MQSIDQRPLGSLEALGRKLGVGVRELTRIASDVDRHYYPAKVIIRRGKKPREVFPARPRLRLIHDRLHARVLSRIKFPAYLTGGIRGRSYLANAKQHSGAHILFGQDVEDFYGSITIAHIGNIFQHVLAYPPEVALLLAKLCSRKGSLVQGGVASTLIANLALYRTEPGFAAEMAKIGITYSRFVDDCHLSSHKRLPRDQIPLLQSKARSMLIRHGYKPKRKKQFIASRQQTMVVHNLNVNSSASQSEKKRKSLRAGLYQFQRNCEAAAKWSSELEEQFLRLANRIGQLGLTNPQAAAAMRRRLREAAAFRD